MSNVLGNLFGEIANAIRAKTGGTGTMKPAEFPTQIAAIPTGGGSSADVRYVTFIGADGATLIVKPVAVGDDCADVVAKGLISTPTKEMTVAEVYTYSGWSLTEGGAASSSALKNVTEDRTVYAAFTATARLYWARFYDDSNELMQESQVAYGTQATPPDTTKEGYAFVSWTPSNLTIYGDTDFVGTWEVDGGWLANIPIPTDMFSASIVHVAYSPDGTKLFCAGTTQLHMLDATTKPYSLLQTITTSSTIGGIAVNSSGTMLAVTVKSSSYSDMNNLLHFYTIGTSTLTKLSPAWASAGISDCSSPSGVTFSSDDSKVYWFAKEKRVFECNLNDYTYNEILTVNSYYGTTGVVAVSPDGTKLFASAQGQYTYNNFAIVDLSNNNEDITAACFGNTSNVGAQAAAYSPDGKYIAVALPYSNQNSTVNVYDTSTTPYTLVYNYKPKKSATGVVFSEDGTLLFASIAQSPYLYAWEVGTWAAQDAPLVAPVTNGVIAIGDSDKKLAVGYRSSPYLSLYEIRR